MSDNSLSQKDRLLFINQFKILERLYPEEADFFSQHRVALERGYTLHYDWLYEHLFDEMPREQCQEVIEILNMYRELNFCYENLKDKSEIDPKSLRFPGFDANYESSQYLYAEYFLIDLDRFQELHPEYPGGLNSHSEMLPIYRAMLRRMAECKNRNDLTRDDLIAILKVNPR